MKILLENLFSESCSKKVVENIESITFEKTTDEDNKLEVVKKSDLHIENFSFTYKKISFKIGYLFVGKWFWVSLIFAAIAFILSMTFGFLNT